MAKQIKVKDIAQMAGVSAGTVDRVLHKRGNVSAKSREAVEKVLSEVGYKYKCSAIFYQILALCYSENHKPKTDGSKIQKSTD